MFEDLTPKEIKLGWQRGIALDALLKRIREEGGSIDLHSGDLANPAVIEGVKLGLLRLQPYDPRHDDGDVLELTRLGRVLLGLPKPKFSLKWLQKYSPTK